MNSQSSEQQKMGFRDLIKSNKKSLIILCIIIFFLGAVFFWLDYSEKNKRIKISESFIEAKILLSENNQSKSLEVLKNIIMQQDKVYSPLSLFLILDQDLEKDNKIVLSYFDQILSIGDLKSEDVNLLRLKKAIFISNESKEQDMLELLNPVINSNSVWKFQSLKFLADYYFSSKQFKKAEQYYSILLNLGDDSINLNEIKRKIKLIKNG
tara:strand:+ start:1609 stop:2238 length:630 start_codon:yes stop_codon:yes gene_type:complete